MTRVKVLRALGRLFTIQGVWNYERMQGIGMGYAALPLLSDLARTDPARHRAAVARQVEFFNAHPFLAGIALGASVRAEYEDLPGEQVTRLRTVLGGTLGALGDQFFWSGLLPGLLAVALVLAVAGAPLVGVAVFLTAFNTVRIGVGWWGLRRGLREGPGVAVTLPRSWLGSGVGRVGLAAGFLMGVAIPLVGAWLVQWFPAGGSVLGGVVALVGIGLGRWSNRVTGLRFTLVAVVVVVLAHWIAS